MPFISQAYLRYLESQMGGGAQSTLDPGPDVPPPADPAEPPTTAPFGPPGQGGPGSYPSAPPTGPIGPPIAQPPYPSNIPPNPFGGTPISNPPTTGGDYPPGTNPGGIDLPVPPTGPTGTGQPYPIPGNPFPTPVNPTPTAPPTQPGGNAPPAPAPPGGTQPAGVDLNINDRINMILHSMGLPPLPAGFNAVGGLPPGFAENPNIGGGAPIFSFTDPTLNSGPQWNPGGSIYGGRGLPITPGTYVGAVGGSPSPINFGALPNSWANQMGVNAAASAYQGPLSYQQYKALMDAAIAAAQARAAGTDYVPGGGSQFRGTSPTKTQ